MIRSPLTGEHDLETVTARPSPAASSFAGLRLVDRPAAFLLEVGGVPV